MKVSKLAPFFIIFALGIVLFLLQREQQDSGPDRKEYETSAGNSSRGLDRHPERIAYSSHARCRMKCRGITQEEVREVLEEGKINYRKSDLQQDNCHKRYAVEDRANGQHIRIIVAVCGRELTVITCIDLDKEWTCHCPGD